MKIKVKFVDFWENMKIKELFIYRQLSGLFDVEISDDPDYLFFSVFGSENMDKKYDNCVKIFFTGECYCPDFNYCDYSIGFDYISFGDRYIRMPIYFGEKYRDNVLLATNKHLNAEIKLNCKTEFCSFVYSNGNADKTREELFRNISEYKFVKSGGHYLNNLSDGKPVKNKLEFEKSCKFSIVCENTSHAGYTTEKLIDGFAAETVPIYWGDPLVKKVFNQKAMICVSDFADIRSLVKYIITVDNDDALYLSYLKEPAIIGGYKYFETELQNFDVWLRNIFEQDKEKAFRRPMSKMLNAYSQREINHIPTKNLTVYLVQRYVNAIKGRL